MRRITFLFLALAVLPLAPSAHAQNAIAEKAMFDQVRQGESLPPPALAPPVLTPPEPDLTRSLQVELKRIGCFEGAVDGIWEGRTKLALADVARRAKLDVATDVPTPIAVEALKSRRDRICPLNCGAGRIERNGSCVAKAVVDNKPARPQIVGETKRPPRANAESERPSMCLRNDGRTTALVPCSDAPGSRRVY